MKITYVPPIKTKYFKLLIQYLVLIPVQHFKTNLSKQNILKPSYRYYRKKKKKEYKYFNSGVEMSLYPVIRRCKYSHLQRLFSQRTVPKHSPIFKLVLVIDQDHLGKHLGRSTSPNCVVHDSLVIARENIKPGTALTVGIGLW